MSVKQVSLMSLLVVSLTAYAQDAPAPAAPAPAAPAAAPAAPAPPTWSVGPIDFSGLIDGYADVNFNHPTPATLGNQLYNFDYNADQFSLSMLKLSMSHAADPIGFQVDLGFGKAFQQIHAGDGDPSATQYIEQAYVTWKPAKAKGMALDFGEFVTSAGAEVIEANANWNYSRSLLFAWAIPYYHFGARLTQPIGSHFTAGVQLVNGWNNVVDNNKGKTIGLVGNFAWKKFSWNNDYYTGPENPGTNKGFRNLYDTTAIFTPADKFNAYVNFDYGQNAFGSGIRTAKWYGVALAGKFQMNGKNAITPRYEWFKDRDGFETGTAQKLQEFTFTYEYKWVEGVLTRIEYRRDWSDQPFFVSGDVSNGKFKKNQDTLTLAVVAFFGPKR